jgi:hypothetical protein
MLLAVESPVGVIQFNVANVATSVFQVAGTMVALALPAAELASNAITNAENLLIASLRHTDRQKQLAETELVTDEMKQNLQPAWRASVFALCSFVLSAFAMIAPDVKWRAGGLALSVDSGIVAASLMFLVVAALSFFPTVRYVFHLEGLDNISRAIRLMQASAGRTEPSTVGTEPQPSVKQT